MGVEKLRNLENAARRAVDDIKALVRRAGAQAKEKAEAAASETYGLNQAIERLNAATAARIAGEDATPAHKWEGRKVFQMANVGRGWSREKKRVEGIVETTRSGTIFAGNLSRYSRPTIGTAIVRELKKDGTPGLKFHLLDRAWGVAWKLCDPTPEDEPSA